MAEPRACHEPPRADRAQLYELLVSELTDFAVFLIDPDGCIQSWNPGVERLLGYRQEDWLGRPADMIFTAEDRAAKKPQEELGVAIREGRAPDLRWHQKKDGSRLFVEGTLVALKDKAGQLLGFSKVMRDVTGRKQQEDELRGSENQLQALVHASSEVLYRMSPDWTEMRQLGGGGFLTDTAHPERRWLEKYVHPDDRGLVLEAIEHAIRKKTNFDLEYRVERADGTPGWAHSRAVPLLDANGEITEWFGAATDITARKRTEEALRRSNEDLERFAYVISHDLQEPLRQVTTFSQLLTRKYSQEDPDLIRYTNLIVDGTKRMQGLTEDLLSLALPEPVVPAECVEVNEILHEVLQSFEGQIEDSHAQVIVDGPLPRLIAPRAVVGQTLQNLISNALKYRHEERSPEIHVCAERIDGEWVFRVSDNGLGIPAEYRSRVFQWFWRAREIEAPGSGIGLASIRRMLERVDGRIWFESERGVGSTFSFALPVKPL